MSVLVHDMKKEYTIRMNHEGNNVDFIFRQLTYAEKSEIVMKTTTHKQGTVVQDNNLSDYLAIQTALIRVKGLHKLVEGKEVEYELSFDNEKRITANCMNEIFNTPFEDKLIYSAKHVAIGIPRKIIHPLTGKEIEGVEIIMPKGGMPKKQSTVREPQD